MTDKVQKIRAEIERLKYQSAIDSDRQAERGLQSASMASFGKEKACKELLSFIDSLQEEPVSKEIGDYDHKAVMESLHPELKEEPVSEELEEAAWVHYDKNKPLMPQELALHREFVSFFKAGAKWKEEQMMAKAIDAQCFGFQYAALFSFRLPADKYLVGSEVKVIVINDD